MGLARLSCPPPGPLLNAGREPALQWRIGGDHGADVASRQDRAWGTNGRALRGSKSLAHTWVGGDARDIRVNIRGVKLRCDVHAIGQHVRLTAVLDHWRAHLEVSRLRQS